METLKIACPRCGSIEAFARLETKLSFASLLGEACITCGHEVSFADVKDMRNRLANAIGSDNSAVTISAYSLRHLSAKVVSRSRSSGRHLSGA